MSFPHKVEENVDLSHSLPNELSQERCLTHLEGQRDLLMRDPEIDHEIVGHVYEKLRSAIIDLFAGQSRWKDQQHLYKRIGKMPHTVTQAMREKKKREQPVASWAVGTLGAA